MTTQDQPSPNRIKDQILTENTAQAVLKHLKANQSNRRRMLARWIWELLQNARDTSGATQGDLVASIAYQDGDLIFQHTGRPFTMFELGHLIFHGSTKIEDKGLLGRYGSGFLTTHLISPEIEVSGRLDDGRAFQFTIRREDGSVQELSASMDRAWQEFNASLARTRESKEFTTRFRYPVTEDSTDAVKSGLDTLMCCAPFVIVFNPEFSMIEARSADAYTSFRKVDRKQPADKNGPSLITVLETKDGNEARIEYLVENSGHTSVAVPLEHMGEARGCASATGIPRLFLGFPLAGTEDFSFPVVINSFDFTPTEDRDGVFLGQGTDDANRCNQNIIEEACGMTADLICFAASSGWRNTHVLASVPTVRSQEWLDLEWFRGVLKDHFVGRIRASPSIIAGEGDPLTPSEARVPVAESDDGVDRLWQLLHGWRDLRDLLPAREEAAGWSRALNSWVETYPDRDQGPSSLFQEVVDGETLASKIEERTRDGDKYAETPGTCRACCMTGFPHSIGLIVFISSSTSSDLQETVEKTPFGSRSKWFSLTTCRHFTGTAASMGS